MVSKTMTDADVAELTPVVGVGSSAGGLEALGTLCANIPDDTVVAYVIIPHLAPDRPSMMDQLLQDKTKLPVRQAADGDVVKPGTIFVAPPGAVVSIDGDVIGITPRDRTDGFHRPIDHFFKSLAEREGRRSFCIVLSGSGSDGAAGLRAIKATGGFAFVQQSNNARFPGMPDSAVATGLVDFILNARDIPERIEEIARYHSNLDIETYRKSLQEDIEAAIPEIAHRLADVSGNDFSSYKPGTLVRRIERRMSLLRTQTVEQFIDTINKDEKQAALLAQEFLIGVTRFFRDGDAFDVLRKKVIRPLVERDERSLRIWVPGCSTGEEVYSIAMVAHQEMIRVGSRRPLQIFGTDIDGPALIHARYGLYPPSGVEDLDKDTLKEFFTIENGQYRVQPFLREACVFAPHNLAQDPPFSRVDLISCRNLLIYLSSDLQKTILPRFHFALRDRGFLFLGPSEGVAGCTDLFDAVHKKHKIFFKNDNAPPRYSALRDTQPRQRRNDAGMAPPPVKVASSILAERSQGQFAEREFLRRRANPFALVSAAGNIRYLSEHMTDFVNPTAGVPSTSIDAYLTRELRVPVRSALADAARDTKSVIINNILVSDASEKAFYDIYVDPVGSMGPDNFLVTLRRVRALQDEALEDVVRDRDLTDRDSLESENFALRRQLSGALQEYETSGQELKSTNEELMSMNEELQSSNEELETSREELQSINEELETVNAELLENNRQLQRANSDLKNLFESTDIAVLFLDQNLCVRNFTPAARTIFGVKIRDMGRPISDLSSKIHYPELAADAASVEESLQTFEREVQLPASEETFLVRIKPYRTTDNVIDGYVLSFIDITSRKRYEETLRHNEREMARQYAELENLYDTTPVGLSLVSKDFRWLRINETLAEINGFPVAEHQDKTFRELLPDIADTLEAQYSQVFETGEAHLGIDIVGETPSDPGVTRNWILDIFPVKSEGKVFAVGACVREITAQTRMMDQLLEQNKKQNLLLGELQHRVKNTLATVSAISRLALRKKDTAKSYQGRLAARLQAMSRTHDVLTRENWSPLTISQLVEAEMSMYADQDGPRYAMKGPDFLLGSDQSAAMGMALHELTTNAAKYGALSTPSGCIQITTKETKMEDGTPAWSFQWIETDGPAVTPPEEFGFGQVVLDSVLSGDLYGTTNVEYAEEGLKFSLVFPKDAATS